MKYFSLKYLKISWNFEIFQDPFLKLLIFNIKRLNTFKNMIKVYRVSRRYIMLFMHNNKYPLTGLLTLLQWTIHNTSWNFWNISEIFHEIFISVQKNSRNFTSLVTCMLRTDKQTNRRTRAAYPRRPTLMATSNWLANQLVANNNWLITNQW